MDKVPTEVLNKIQKYLADLESNHFHVEKAILFGSYAKGTYNEWSDIDLALVSDAFEGNRILDKDKIRDCNAKIGYDISPLPYRPEDFNEDDFFVKEILETGIEIK